ncbi:unnamed protein product [Paramecium pentaurelia]|uniref:Uncharacterized protein n=1 Tax=Paramecium pentaurelia TaxID=43138 RepID=A0A8S1VEU0_9CILI|nr:unnamed protein product [Paramecium pentaurelia]
MIPGKRWIITFINTFNPNNYIFESYIDTEKGIGITQENLEQTTQAY